jgi:two-component system nitrate/nitrite sensor histidine kinase NarX
MTCSVAYRLSFTATTQIMNLKIREKISGLLILYFFIALVAIGSTLLVSWKLEGGAAAINDAGRERMRSYRIAYLLEQYSQNPSFDLRKKIETEVADFSDSLIELDLGNPSRPLLLPKDTKVKRQMKELREVWRFKIYPDILTILNETDPTKQKSLLTNYRSLIEAYVLKINELVSMVELSNAHATGLLRFLQVALVSLALIGTILLIFMFSKMVVNPMLVLTEGIQRMTNADFSVRLPVTSRDEFGDLAAGFNRMAGELQDLYATL